jgi:hypothetical protein
VTRPRGAPRLTEREDPLSFVLRNRGARELLEALEGQPLMTPLALRKSVQVHPETFRRLVFALDEFALVSIRASPRRSRLRHDRPRSLRIPIGLELTVLGKNLLDITREVRETVRRHSRNLPEASATHWLV